MMKMTLPDFLKWAFAEELAHVATDGGSLSWARLADYSRLGTVVDTSSFGGGLPELAHVHPDALAAHEAVMMLASDALDLPEGWAPFDDMADPHGLIAGCVREVLDRRALRYAGDLNQNLIALVIARAVMGRAPDWTAEQPAFRMVMRAGRPAWFMAVEEKDVFGRVHRLETDGYDARAGRPRRGAYRKYEMDGRFSGAVQARIDWYLWAMAMERIAGRLGAGLKSHVVLPFAIEREPWKFAGAAQAIETAAE